MKIFGYGSLLCEDSLRKTVKEYITIGPVCLTGFRRTFNLESRERINPATGQHSCVLNLEKDKDSTVCGILYEIPEEIVDKLNLREEGYGMEHVTFDNGEKGHAYMAAIKHPYKYLRGDPIQQEYLDICLKASRLLGDTMYQNFLDSTFIDGVRLRDSDLV